VRPEIEDPDLWGYTIPEGEDQPFLPKVHAEDEQMPVRLHLVGNMADEPVEFPKELAKIIVHHANLPQSGFYDILGQMVGDPEWGCINWYRDVC